MIGDEENETKNELRYKKTNYETFFEKGLAL